jgi:hypothetical protein
MGIGNSEEESEQEARGKISSAPYTPASSDSNYADWHSKSAVIGILYVLWLVV